MDRLNLDEQQRRFIVQEAMRGLPGKSVVQFKGGSGKKNLVKLNTPPELVKLSELHKAIGRLMAMGYGRKKIEEQLGTTSYTIHRCMHSHLFRIFLNEEREKFAKMVAAEVAANSSRARVNRSVLKAADRLDTVLDREDEKHDANAVKAADVILKHAMPKEESGSGGVGGVVINVSSSKGDTLAILEKEVEGMVIDGECIEGDGSGCEPGSEDERSEADRIAVESIGSSGVQRDRF